MSILTFKEEKSAETQFFSNMHWPSIGFHSFVYAHIFKGSYWIVFTDKQEALFLDSQCMSRPRIFVGTCTQLISDFVLSISPPIHLSHFSSIKVFFVCLLIGISLFCYLMCIMPASSTSWRDISLYSNEKVTVHKPFTKKDFICPPPIVTYHDTLGITESALKLHEKMYLLLFDS